MLYVISAAPFYCDILHLYNIVKFSNICKPEEGWYGQPKYGYKKQYIYLVHALLLLMFLSVAVFCEMGRWAEIIRCTNRSDLSRLGSWWAFYSPIAHPPAHNTPCFPLSKFWIRHLHISHIIMHLICDPPHPPTKFFITFVFHFSWVLEPSQEKLQKMLMRNFGEQIRCIVGNVQVAYNLKCKGYVCAN